MPHVERVDDDLIAINSKWTEKELIKLIPGSLWDKANNVWTVPLTWAACLQLRGIFKDELTVGPKLTEWSYHEYVNRVVPAVELRTAITRASGPYDEKLYDFQTAGAEFLRVAKSALLGDDLGMGKTAQILAVIQTLDKLGDNALPALVICPNSVKPGWVKQASQWSINCVPYMVTGSAKNRRDVLAAAAKDPRALVIVNIESVRLFSRLAAYGSTNLKSCRACRRYGEEGLTPARCEVHLKELNNFGFKTVICDEAHRIKDPSSKQTRAVWAVGHDPSVTRRLALTGTPVANHVADLWSIMHFLEPNEYPTRGKFIDRYALLAWNAFGSMDIIGINPDTRDEFFKILDSRFRRTPKALVLTQLPRVIRVTRWVNMSAKQAHAYTELEKRSITRLESGEVLITPNNLINATRLLQLSSTYCDAEWIADPTPEDPEHMKCLVTLREPSPKLDEMEAIYDELGGKPVVIAAQSRQLIELAALRFKKRKIPYGMIVGGVSDWERQQVIQQFHTNHINVVLLTIQAGGTGLDGLQHADTMICLQRSWSMIENTQLDGRIDRIGSEKHSSVTIIDIVAKDTIEETTQHPRLAEKYEQLELINRDRMRLIENGGDIVTLTVLDEAADRVMRSSLGVPSNMLDYADE